MNNSERAAFDDQIRQLFAGFNVPATQERLDAYWRGLQRMQLATVTRVIDYALSEDGPEKLPTAPGLWRLTVDMRASGGPTITTPDTTGPQIDDAGRLGNVSLFRCLALYNGPRITDARMHEIVTAKNRLVDAYRRLPDDERSPNELRDLIAGAFDRIVQARSSAAA